jgi:hypothetical protein
MTANIPLGQRVPMNSFRYFAVWAWERNTSPNVFLTIEFNVSRTLEFLAKRNAAATASISVFHAFLKVMGLTLEEYPALNRVLLGKKLYIRQHIDFFIVKALQADNPFDRYDLTGFKLRSPHAIALGDYPALVNRNIGSSVEKSKRLHNFSFAIARACPLFLARFLVRFYDWFAYSFNIRPEVFGFPSDQFGSMWVSNIGSLGLPSASVPHFPISRCGLGASIGKAEKKAMVENDRVVIQDILPVTFSYDHRLYDACHVADAVEYMKKLFREPELFA